MHPSSLHLTGFPEITDLPYDNINQIRHQRGWPWSSVVLVTETQELRLWGLANRDAEVLVALLPLFQALPLIRRCNVAFDHLLRRDRYLNNQALDDWASLAEPALDVIRKLSASTIFEAVSESILQSPALLYSRWRTARQVANARNEAYAASLLEQHRAFFDEIESYPLTKRQREAIVHDEDNCLVVAAAGTGKTSTLVGKVAFLTEREKVAPESILLLAFARKASEEIEARVEKVTAKWPACRTFHSLGLEIVSTVEGKRPSLSRFAEDQRLRHRVIHRYLMEILDCDTQRQWLVDFLAYHRYPEKSRFEFKTIGDYYAHLKDHEPRTLQGELVKSWEELAIANFLCLNGIRYTYEQDFEHPTATIEYSQYRPDFHLPDYGVYIEHFGVDRHGNTAPWVDRSRYLQGMRWKRDIHRQHGTKLVETYSYEYEEGTLRDQLHDRLSALNVRFHPLGSKELHELLQNHQDFPGIVTLLGTFLSLFKGNHWTLTELKSMAVGEADRPRLLQFLALFEKVYERYETELYHANEIDFEEMIRRATEYASSGQYESPYTHIIVDEWQDISRGRALLLKALLDQHHDRRLFVVGDDWQSIYRFTGSDIGLMTGFPEVFGFTRRTDLDLTFRYGENLRDLSTRFILRNPHQLQKEFRSRRDASGPAVAIFSSREEGAALQSVVNEIATEHVPADKAISVLLLGRYNHSRPEALARLQRQSSSLSLEYKTVHASKGLEADFVVLVDLKRGRYGFPSQITDDPVLRFLLPAEKGFPNAEERRLFYVALTRARYQVYLIAAAERLSSFVAELREDSYRDLIHSELEGLGRVITCPECKSGELVGKVSRYGRFWVCSNAPYCPAKRNACPECTDHPFLRRDGAYTCTDPACSGRVPACPCCGAILRVRRSPHGEFYGCSNWRPSGASCTYTRSL